MLDYGTLIDKVLNELVNPGVVAFIKTPTCFTLTLAGSDGFTGSNAMISVIEPPNVGDLVHVYFDGASVLKRGAFVVLPSEDALESNHTVELNIPKSGMRKTGMMPKRNMQRAVFKVREFSSAFMVVEALIADGAA